MVGYWMFVLTSNWSFDRNWSNDHWLRTRRPLEIIGWLIAHRTIGEEATAMRRLSFLARPRLERAHSGHAAIISLCWAALMTSLLMSLCMRRPLSEALAIRWKAPFLLFFPYFLFHPIWSRNFKICFSDECSLVSSPPLFPSLGFARFYPSFVMTVSYSNGELSRLTIIRAELLLEIHCRLSLAKCQLFCASSIRVNGWSIYPWSLRFSMDYYSR